MNIVLYSRLFELITVIDLPVDAINKAKIDGSVKIPIKKPSNTALVSGNMEYVDKSSSQLTISSAVVSWIDGIPRQVLIVDNDELALMLKPSWLPGQRAAINDMSSVISTLLKPNQKS